MKLIRGDELFGSFAELARSLDKLKSLATGTCTACGQSIHHDLKVERRDLILSVIEAVQSHGYFICDDKGVMLEHVAAVAAIEIIKKVLDEQTHKSKTQAV